MEQLLRRSVEIPREIIDDSSMFGRLTHLTLEPMFLGNAQYKFCTEQFPVLQELKAARIMFECSVESLQSLRANECIISSLDCPAINVLHLNLCEYDHNTLERFDHLAEIALSESEDTFVTISSGIMETLKTIHLDHVTINSISSYTAIEELVCKDSGVTNSDLRMMPKLRTLRLKHCDISDITMLRNLQDLYVYGCSFGSFGLSGLKLRTAELYWTNVSEILFTASELTIENSPVKDLPEMNLDYLRICDTKLSDLSMVHIRRLMVIGGNTEILGTVNKGLEELHLVSCFGSFDMSYFKALKKLRWETSYPEMPGITNTDISGIPVEELYLGNSEITSLRSLKGLRKLTCRGPFNGITQKSIKGLALEHLEFIDQ